MRRALLGAILLAVVWSRSARATGESILLVVDPQSPGAAKRVEAELSAAGFTVVTRTSSEPADRGALLEDGRRIDAVATVRVHATGAGAELWIVDRVTGKTVFRDVARAQAPDDATLATKTTELLRASLLEVRTVHFQPAEVAVPEAVDALLPPTDPAPAPPASAPPRGFVMVGGTVGWGGDLGALGSVATELRVRLARVVAAGLAVTIPVTQSSLHGTQGSSSQVVSHAAFALDVAPLGFTSHVSPFAGVTAGALWFRASGTADAPYTSEVANLFSAAFGLRAGADLRLTSSLAIRAQVAALAALPQPTVVYAGSATGSLAEPLVEATVGLELAAW